MNILKYSHIEKSHFLSFLKLFSFGCAGSLCRVWAFSLVAASEDYSLVVLLRLLFAVASLMKHRL